MNTTTAIQKMLIIPQPREYTRREAEQAVLRGAVALTQHFESIDWVDRIDPDALVMSNPDRCILGQVFGGFIAGLDRLGLDEDGAAYAHGFDVPLAPSVQLNFWFLLAAWKDLLADLADRRVRHG